MSYKDGVVYLTVLTLKKSRLTLLPTLVDHIAQYPVQNDKNHNAAYTSAFASAYFLGAPTGQ